MTSWGLIGSETAGKIKYYQGTKITYPHPEEGPKIIDSKVPADRGC